MVMTLLDVVRKNNSDKLVGLIEEAMKATPEVNIGAARPISGTNFKTLVRTSVATGNLFRNANDGIDAADNKYEQRLVETFLANKSWWVDKGIAIADEDGPGALMAMAAAGVLMGMMQDLGSQFYYGTDTLGFAGLTYHLNSVSHDMVVNAGGTSGGSIETSVYFVRWEEQGVRWIVGNNGDLSESDVTERLVTGQNSKQLNALWQEILGYIGLQIGSTDCIARVANLTDESGKGMTDDLIADALATFPAGKEPNAIYLNRTTAKQLKQSRTATSVTGAPAPWVTGVEGIGGQMIPVMITDSISNSEGILS